jgi:NADH pyrophosphatase NudC (nudix superfamily)
VIYLALVLIVIGVALFVAAPLFESVRARGASNAISERSRLEHERALAVQGLRDLEFDHEMRKLSEQDWTELKQNLEARALRAMAALEKLDQTASDRGARAPRRPVRIADAPAGGPSKFCPDCGQPVAAKTNFCGNCGAPLNFPEDQQDALSHG